MQCITFKAETEATNTGELEGNWKEIDFGLLLLEKKKFRKLLRMLMGLASHFDSSLR